MPSVATQTAFKDMLASASPGSPRNPISLPKDWQYYQPPSWTRRTRRGGMSKKTYQWCMMHSFSQTEGGMYNAAAWGITIETSDAYAAQASYGNFLDIDKGRHIEEAFSHSIDESEPPSARDCMNVEGS